MVDGEGVLDGESGLFTAAASRRLHLLFWSSSPLPLLFIRLSFLVRFFNQRRLPLYLFQQFLGVLRIPNDFGAQENHQLDFVRRFILFLERPPDHRDASEDRGLSQRIRHLLLDDSAQDEGLPVFGPEVGAEVARVEKGAAQHGLAGHDRGGFGVDFQLDVTRGVDVRGDFENDAHVFVLDTRVLSAQL